MMRRALFLSLRLHAQWFFEAFSKKGRSLAPLTPRRLGCLLLLFPLFLLLQACNWLGLLLDEVFYPGYRKVKIKDPLFVTGIPRSGTTFLHRTLARDEHHFTTFQTWQALLAPSISQRRLANLLSRLDRSIGRPCHRCLTILTHRVTGNMEHIHAVGLQAPEEDYLALLPAAGCFIMMTAFPASQSLWQLGRFNTLPSDQRQPILQFYTACLKKHLYAAPPGSRLLSKNAAFASWLPELRTAFPDAGFIFCIREPGCVLSSQLSSLHPGLSFFGTVPATEHIAAEMQGILIHAYRILFEAIRLIPAERYFIIEQGQLKDNTRSLLLKGLHHLGLPVTTTLHRCIDEAAARSNSHTSRHHHAQLNDCTGKEDFESLVTDQYTEIVSRLPRIDQ